MHRRGAAGRGFGEGWRELSYSSAEATCAKTGGTTAAMDLRFGTQYEQLRTELRAFLAENWNAEQRAKGRDLREKQVAFRKCAIERGYLARGVPRKYGGSEQPPDPFRGVIVGQEFGAVGAPQDVAPPVTQATHPCRF